MSDNSSQVSAGGVVFHYFGQEIRLCLVLRANEQREVWCLPKGHIEAGESKEQAAIREVKEETGLSAEIVQPLQNINYWFYDRETKTKIHKTVYFYLMKYIEGSLEHHDYEVEKAEWYQMSEVLKKAAYPGERSVLEEAIKTLQNRPRQ